MPPAHSRDSRPVCSQCSSTFYQHSCSSHALSVCGGAQDWTDFASGAKQVLSCECCCVGYGVNVFVYGHVHAYERTSPVYDYNVRPSRLLYKGTANHCMPMDASI